MFNFKQNKKILNTLMDELTNPVIILDKDESPIWINTKMKKLIGNSIEKNWNHILLNSFTRIDIDENQNIGLISHLRPKEMWKVKSKIFKDQRILELLPANMMEKQVNKNDFYAYSFRDVLNSNFKTLQSLIEANNIKFFTKPVNQENISIPYKTLSNSMGLLLKSLINSFPESSVLISFKNQKERFFIDIEIRTTIENQVMVLEKDLESPFRNFENSLDSYSTEIRPYKKSSSKNNCIGLEITFNNFHRRSDIINEFSFQ